MTIPTEVIMRMATLGLSEDQAKAVADMLTAVETATATTFEATIEAGKEKGRERWRKWNSAKSNVGKRLLTAANVSQQLVSGDARVEDKTLTSEIEPQKEERKKDASAFDAFWAVYPEKVGKGAARKAFPLAISKAPLEILIEGVHRYIAAKPADRSYCHPSTWLNEERWDDAPAAPPVRGSPPQKPLSTHAVAQQLLREMEEADARTEAQIEGSGTAVVSFSAYQQR